MRGPLSLVLSVLLGATAGVTLTLALAEDDPAPGPATEPLPDAAEAIVGAAEVRTLLAWTPGRLPVGFAEDAAALSEVSRVAEVRSGLAWATAWREAGGPVRRPPQGLQVPLEVAALAADEYAAFVPPAERATFLRLGPGEALLGETGASLRGVGAGGMLRLGSVRLDVSGVVADELVGAHEVVVTRATGARLGGLRPRYVLVDPGRDASRRAVEEGLRSLLPGGARLRVRGPGETPVFRHGDAVLPPARIKELFGEFAAVPAPGGFLRMDPGWEREQVVEARVPVLGTVRCHRAIVPLLRGALGDLAGRGLGHLIDPGDYGGCYSPRYINRDPAAGLSHHAWGIAIDLNVSANGLGSEPAMDRRVVEAFERWGFTWGGRWLVPDGMHFEFLRSPS